MELSLTKLKMAMLCNTDFTFFTTLLFQLEIIEEKTIPTASVDGKVMRINPDFWNSLTKDTRTFVLLHEVMHVALNHITRLGDREHRKFNAACDYAANYDLVDCGYIMPEGGLYDSKYKGMTAEQIYDLLPDGDYPEPDIIFSDDPHLAQELDKILLSAGAAAKMAGKMAKCIPDCANRRLEELMNPKLHWKVIFQDCMLEHSTDDFSMDFPDEEYMPGLYVPTLYSEGMGALNIYCDVSASVSQRDLNIALSEVNSLRMMLSPSSLTLVSFDTRIHLAAEYGKHDIVDMTGINMAGGGGTHIGEVAEHILEGVPEIAVIITDGYLDASPANNITEYTNLIWLIFDNTSFETTKGRVIHVNTKEY